MGFVVQGLLTSMHLIIFYVFFCRSTLNIFEVSQYDFILFSLIY